jgi:hypothetical protein
MMTNLNKIMKIVLEYLKTVQILSRNFWWQKIWSDFVRQKVNLFVYKSNLKFDNWKLIKCYKIAKLQKKKKKKSDMILQFTWNSKETSIWKLLLTKYKNLLNVLGKTVLISLYSRCHFGSVHNWLHWANDNNKQIN